MTYSFASSGVCIGMTVPLELMVIEFADGAITGTGFRMARNPPDLEKGLYLTGSHSGTLLRLRAQECDTGMPTAMVRG